MQIKPDDLTGSAIKALLQEHLEHMRSISPPESTHALDLDGLRAPDVSFWCAWSAQQELLGCGALKQLDAAQGEIKSMRTARAHLRKGVAAGMLTHLIHEARRGALPALRLCLSATVRRLSPRPEQRVHAARSGLTLTPRQGSCDQRSRSSSRPQRALNGCTESTRAAPRRNGRSRLAHSKIDPR